MDLCGQLAWEIGSFWGQPKHWLINGHPMPQLGEFGGVSPTSEIGLPRWCSSKECPCQCRRHRVDPWVGKIPWRRKWQPTPVFLPGKLDGQRSLAGSSPHQELDMTERDWAPTSEISVGPRCEYCKAPSLLLLSSGLRPLPALLMTLQVGPCLRGLGASAYDLPSLCTSSYQPQVKPSMVRFISLIQPGSSCVPYDFPHLQWNWQEKAKHPVKTFLQPRNIWNIDPA